MDARGRTFLRLGSQLHHVQIAVRRAAIEKGLDGGIDWDRLDDPSAHLGSANAFVDRILDDAKRTIR